MKTALPKELVLPRETSMKTLANKVLATGLICVMLAFTSACNSATALADVQRFEPVVINALNLACVISPGAGICGAMQVTVTNDYNTVVKLWADYNAAAAAGTATSALWNDLNAAFATFEEDSAQIFSLGLGLNAPELTAIIAAAQVLLATIEVLFPSAPAGALRAASKKFSKYRVAGPYDQKWVRNWRHDYNEKLSVAQKLHPTAKLRKV